MESLTLFVPPAEIVPVFSANLQYKITYQRNSVESLKHQFDGLIYKYNDIFCPYPEECGISNLDSTTSVRRRCGYIQVFRVVK